jgi:hypothetical protein
MHQFSSAHSFSTECSIFLLHCMGLVQWVTYGLKNSYVASNITPSCCCHARYDILNSILDYYWGWFQWLYRVLELEYETCISGSECGVLYRNGRKLEGCLFTFVILHRTDPTVVNWL